MITLLHGGQTGVDRGAHEAAIDNGWSVAGYMPRDARDERGRIPPDVARFLVPHDRSSYAARTEANVRASSAVLVVARNAEDPCATPGTAKTLDLAAQHKRRRLIVDPTFDAAQIARWIRSDLLATGTLWLPLEAHASAPISTRLLVAGPRESKWSGARAETAALLRRVAQSLTEIVARPIQPRDLAPGQR